MSINWPTVTLEEVAKIKSGKRLPKGQSLVGFKTDYPYIRLVDIESGKIQSSNLQYLMPETREHIQRYVVNSNDICLAIVGHTIGLVFFVTEEWDNVNLTENAARITELNECFNPKFVYYYLSSSFGQSEIASRAVGSAQGKLPLYNIKSLPIPRPPREYQDYVVTHLDSIDEKIELNQQTNQTLEQMAQALFKSWFVDFDPVVDNALAAGNPIPDELSHRVEVRKKAHALIDFQPLPEHIRNLFPNEFEQTGEPNLGIDGWVPKGWIADSLKGYSTKISKGTTPRKRDVEEANKPFSIPFLKVKDMDDNGQINHESLELIPQEVHIKQLKRSILAEGDIVFSIAGTIGRVSQITSDLDGINCNQAIAFIRPLSTRHGLWLKFFLDTVSAQNQVKNKVTQAVQANVNLTDLGNLRFVSPSKELLSEFEHRIKPINEKCELFFKSNRSLKKVRDTLLPKFISGEIRLDLKDKSIIDQEAELQGV